MGTRNGKTGGLVIFEKPLHSQRGTCPNFGPVQLLQLQKTNQTNEVARAQNELRCVVLTQKARWAITAKRGISVPPDFPLLRYRDSFWNAGPALSMIPQHPSALRDAEG